MPSASHSLLAASRDKLPSPLQAMIPFQSAVTCRASSILLRFAAFAFSTAEAFPSAVDDLSPCSGSLESPPLFSWLTWFAWSPNLLIICGSRAFWNLCTVNLLALHLSRCVTSTPGQFFLPHSLHTLLTCTKAISILLRKRSLLSGQS